MKQAKLGSFEILLKDGTVVSVESLDGFPLWSRIVLTQMTSQDIGVLIQLYRSRGDGMEIVGAMDYAYRNLRDRGLLEHDTGAMSTASKVWLSESGIELSRMLLHQKQVKTAVD